MKKVSDYLYRGPRPKDLADLKALRFDCIINLQSGVYEFLHNDLYEQQFPCDFGMDQYDIPCSDFTPPTRWQIYKVISTINSHQKTYIHCKHGVDRTGFMVACYRVAMHKADPSYVINEMFENGFHKIPYMTWIPYLRQILKELHAGDLKVGNKVYRPHYDQTLVSY
jgi:protein tyrosine/serine phosphatase